MFGRIYKTFSILFSRPCILIFDSLQTELRSHVVATLREYLQCEYKAKMKEDREFTIHNFKGASPKVPQQPNFSDCGLFALQYVESFLTKPLTDYTLPMKGLRKWFPSEVMRNKRSDIAKIIRDLAMEQNKDGKEIDFPALTFTPDSGSGYTDDEGDSEMKSATSKVLMKTPNRYVCLVSLAFLKVIKSREEFSSSFVQKPKNVSLSQFSIDAEVS